MENIETGLLLMLVGMTTVFAILLIVIYLGKGLIVFVNKYFPEQASGLPASTTAAIVSAISVLTNGKGKVTKIDKQ